MKTLRKRLLSAMLCAVLPTLNISLGGLLPEAVKVDTEMMTASAADTTSPESIFDDSLHGQSEVTDDASIRNADPYGTADGKWNNVYTVPEVYGVYTGSKTASLHDISNSENTGSTTEGITNDENNHSVAVTGMDVGNGKDDTVASIAYHYDADNPDDSGLELSLLSPTNSYGKVSDDFKFVRKVTTLGKTLTYNYNHHNRLPSTTITGTFDYLQDVNANVNGMFLSIAAGDFNGDGKDSMITYVPSWGSPSIQEYNVECRDASELNGEVTVLGVKTETFYTGQYYMPVFSQKIVDNVYDSFKLQKSSVTGNEDRQRDIPLVNLVAADIDKDGRDELIVTAGLGSTTCTGNDSTTKMRIYDYYDGKFHETYTLELTGTYNNKDGLIRYASSAVGNVDVNVSGSGVDFPEIVTAGWVEHDDYLDYFYGMHVTRVQEVKKENDGSYTGVYEFSDSDKLTSTYSTTWESLDIDGGNNLDGVSEYMKNGLHPYGKKAWNHHNKLAVGVVSTLGPAANAQIILGDTIYAIDETNKLQGQYRSRYGGMEKYSIQKVLTGAFDGIHQGAYFLFADENKQFHTTYCYYDGEKWVQQNGILQEDNVGTKSASICNVDIDNDGLRIKLNKVTQGWGDTKPIFVLEAAPYFDELHNGKYESMGDTGSTAITNGYSEGSSVKYSAGVSASLEVGLTGGFSIAGNEIFHLDVGGYYEAALTYSGQTNTERTLEITHANNSGENAVIVARAPYYVYEYKIDGSNEKFYVGTYGSPQTAGISIDKYNELAREFNKDKNDDRKILLIDTDKNNPLLSLGTPGDPYSYRKTFPQSDNSATEEDMRYARECLEDGDVSVPVSNYNSKTSSTKEVTYSHGAEHGFDVELGWGAYLETVATDVKVKVQAGANVGAGYCKFHSSSVKRSGTGANYYNETYPYNNYDFKWDFGFWDVRAYKDEDDSANDSKYISVLGYTVNEITSPTVAPKDFILSSADGNTATFSWELPKVTQGRANAASYILRVTNTQTGNTTNIPIMLSNVEQQSDGRYYYSLSCAELDNRTDYECTLSCVSSGTNWESVPSNEVKFRTENPLSVNIAHGTGLELLEGGKESQKTQYSINTVYYRIKDGYEIPEGYYGESKNGISVLVNDDIISILGSPIFDTDITIPDMKLKTYNISYNLEGGSFTNQTVKDTYQLLNADITLPTPIQAGYEFAGWTDEAGNTVSAISANTTGDRTFTATWTPSENVAYTVNHYFMDTNGRYSTPESEVLYGTTGETVTPQPRETEGFGHPRVQSVKIANDGSTVVSYEYPREKYNLDFKDSKTASIYATRGSYYFAYLVPMEVEIEDGYYFTGWSTDRKNALERYADAPAIDFEIPAKNVTVYPLTSLCQEFGEITLTAEDKEWDGEPVTPDVEIADMNQDDYTVTYEYYSGETKLSDAPKATGTYTVKAIITAKGYNSKEVTKEFTISPKYEDAVYQWNKTDTGYTVTASRKCLSSENADITETVTAVYMVQQEPDFENTGVGVYTAVFENPAFETQTKETVIPVKEVEYTLVEASNATCTSNGNIAYYQGSNGKVYLSDGNGGYTETTKEAVTLARTGHSASSYTTGRVAPTYDSDGYYYRVTYCTKCGTTLSSTRVTLSKLNRTDISSASLSLSQKEFDYTGKEISPAFTVMLNGTELTQDTDYVVSGSTAKDSGTYTLTITGTGAYEGTVSAEWTIKEQPVETPEYSVTVKNGTVNGKTSGTFKSGTVIAVKADAAQDGYKFGYWKKNGKTASYNSVYTFPVTSDQIQLEAVYLEDTDNVERYGYSVKDSVTINSEAGTIKFSYVNNVPEDCTIIKGGVVATCEASKVNALAVGIGSNAEKTTFEVTIQSLKNSIMLKVKKMNKKNCEFTSIHKNQNVVY